MRKSNFNKVLWGLPALGIILAGFAVAGVGPAGFGGQPLAHAASISLDTNSMAPPGETVSSAVGKLKKLPSAGGGGGVPTVPAGKVVVAACLYHHTPNANNLRTKSTQVNVVRGWTTLWSGLTGSDGCFTSGELSKGSSDLKIVLKFESRNSFVYVFDSLGVTFSAVTDEIIISADGYRDLGGYLAETDTSAPFHVLSVMMDGWAYAQKNFGLEPPPVPVRLSTWDVFDWTMESSFNTNIPLDRIVINSKAKYQDQWDDFVILHEYGHFLAKKFFPDGSPGGPHGGQDLTGAAKDDFGGVYSADEARRLAWGEGWATFFAALVSYGNNQAEVAYVDTVYSESGANPYEATHAIEGTWGDGADNEFAVAATLWDIYDAYNFTYLNSWVDTKHDARDIVTLGIVPIIDVLKNYKVDGHSVYTVSDFYTGWFNCPLCQTKNHGGKSGVDLIFYGFDTYQFSCTDADGDGYKTSPCSLDCNDSDRTVNPGAVEICDGKDNDCDGVTDPLCACRDGQTRACGATDTGACQRGVETCRSGSWGSCTGNIEPVTEGCNRDELDNDCDGVTDDLQSTCDYRPYCADFTADTAGSDQHSYIKKVSQGSYCPNPWNYADIDNDGYREGYLLLGSDNSQFVRVWESCRPQVDFGWHVYDFWDGNENSLGCTIAYEDLRKSKSYCSDGSVEYTYTDLRFTSPTDNIVVPEMRCVADDPGRNWWAFWDYRMQWNYADGHQEPALILRCGQDADCKTGEYCQKPVLANPLSYQCASTCGNGVCAAGEVCPADSQGGETCDSKDNNCNGYVDDGLPVACRSDVDCLPDGCYEGGSRDYRCVNAGTCGSRCEYTEKKTDQDGDGFTVECGKDCNDTNPNINPSRSESCDGIDNDCSGAIDDHLVAPLCELQAGVCTDAVKSCGGANGWFACGPYEYGSDYEFVESKLDGLDNDCEGRVDAVGISVSTFQNGLVSEELAFAESGDSTRFLELPKNAEVVRGNMSLAGRGLFQEDKSWPTGGNAICANSIGVYVYTSCDTGLIKRYNRDGSYSGLSWQIAEGANCSWPYPLSMTCDNQFLYLTTTGRGWEKYTVNGDFLGHFDNFYSTQAITHDEKYLYISYVINTPVADPKPVIYVYDRTTDALVNLYFLQKNPNVASDKPPSALFIKDNALWVMYFQSGGVAYKFDKTLPSVPMDQGGEFRFLNESVPVVEDSVMADKLYYDVDYDGSGMWFSRIGPITYYQEKFPVNPWLDIGSFDGIKEWSVVGTLQGTTVHLNALMNGATTTKVYFRDPNYNLQTVVLRVPKSAMVETARVSLAAVPTTVPFDDNTEDSYGYSGSITAHNYAVDEDWDTFASIRSSGATIDEEFTYDAHWSRILLQQKLYGPDGPSTNSSFTLLCWQHGSNDWFVIDRDFNWNIGAVFTPSHVVPMECLTPGQNLILRTQFNDHPGGEMRYYEGSLTGTLLSYPTNVSLEVGFPDGIGKWSVAGEFSQTEKVPVDITAGVNYSLATHCNPPNANGDCDLLLGFVAHSIGAITMSDIDIQYPAIVPTNDFSATLNSVIPQCACTNCQITPDNSCRVPFTFHSDSAGILEYSNIGVFYTIPHCANKIFDGDEKGVDCGGSCATQCVDSDNDCLPDSLDACPFDADCDNDGLIDGSCGTEDRNANGRWDLGETNSMNPDTDYDGIQDGTELGLTQPQTSDTDLTIFVPDSDPATVTSATNSDSDHDGVSDGREDVNGNGGVDAGEASPSMSDFDADGVEDGQDNCPASANANQADDDQDGFGNVCDNCVAAANPDQRDTDADFRGDACEDTTPPVLVCPPMVTVECAGPDGQIVALGLPQAADDSLMSPQVTDDRPLKFSLGETQVTFTARDQDGNASSCSIPVTVTDTTPPTLVCPPDLIALEGSEIHLGQANISDACHGQLTDPPAPQVQLQVGANEITWNTADPSGNTGTCVQNVTIAPDPDRDGIASSSDNCPDAANPGQGDVDANGIGDACEVPFIRGDGNVDGDVDIADAVYTLFHLFRGGPAPSCYDRMDVNDDGAVNLTDPVHLLNVLFKAEGVIAPPAFAAGLDLTKDALVCR